MNKKYQVFISSTYIDLVDERKEVIQALLELDCIPVGMELFPASDDEQWDFIKSVIDDCDYYLLIVAGRYGSQSESGLSYTEMEYRYALSAAIPIISFLHENPDSLSVDKTDKDSELADRLVKFRKLTQKKLCKFWTTPAELGGVVSRSIVQLKKRSPAVGWVKSDLLPEKESYQEILELKDKIQVLKLELEKKNSSSAISESELSNGEEEFKLECTFTPGDIFDDYPTQKIDLKVSWNEIFSIVSPSLINELSDQSLKGRLNEYVSEIHFKNTTYKSGIISVENSSYETILIQLRALNLIEKSDKTKSVSDTNTYWRLTSHGDSIMVGLRAIKSSAS